MFAEDCVENMEKFPPIPIFSIKTVSRKLLFFSCCETTLGLGITAHKRVENTIKRETEKIYERFAMTFVYFSFCADYEAIISSSEINGMVSSLFE